MRLQLCTTTVLVCIVSCAVQTRGDVSSKQIAVNGPADFVRAPGSSITFAFAKQGVNGPDVSRVRVFGGTVVHGDFWVLTSTYALVEACTYGSGCGNAHASNPSNAVGERTPLFGLPEDSLRECLVDWLLYVTLPRPASAGNRLGNTPPKAGLLRATHLVLPDEAKKSVLVPGTAPLGYLALLKLENASGPPSSDPREFAPVREESLLPDNLAKPRTLTIAGTQENKQYGAHAPVAVSFVELLPQDVGEILKPVDDNTGIEAVKNTKGTLGAWFVSPGAGYEKGGVTTGKDDAGYGVFKRDGDGEKLVGMNALPGISIRVDREGNLVSSLFSKLFSGGESGVAFNYHVRFTEAVVTWVNGSISSPPESSVVSTASASADAGYTGS